MKLYDFFNSLAGWTEVRVSGALPEAFLNVCAARNLPLLSCAQEERYALRVRLRTRDLKKAARIALWTQCALEPLFAGGAPAMVKKLRRRALAVLGLLLVFAMLAWSKLYIWEIEVTGNETVPAGRILDGLRECGVGVGTFWPGITSDNLRSELLIELPELAWATVNIYGSRAEVIVRERVPKPEIWRADTPVDVVAKKTGFITEVRTLNGTARVRPGSAVTEGETLISGAVESAYGGARKIHATGVVRAETYYELSAAAPLTVLEKRETGEETTLWSLTIGKNRWNFLGNSSIFGESCDTIAKTWAFGGKVFMLPVSLTRETARSLTLTEVPRDRNLARRELEEALHTRLLSELGADGEVESERYSAAAVDGLLVVTLRARCSEDIGVEVPMP